MMNGAFMLHIKPVGDTQDGGGDEESLAIHEGQPGKEFMCHAWPGLAVVAGQLCHTGALL